MGKKHHRRASATATVPSSPSHSLSSSSSSSDFEFGISNSPATKTKLSSQLIPADELFYKGQLLPLHLSPRISMVRTLLLASSSGSSSSDTTATGSRDSNGSSNESTSSFSGDLLLLAAAAKAFVVEDDAGKVQQQHNQQQHHLLHSKYLSSLATKFSSVFHRNRSKDVNKCTVGGGGIETQISDSCGVTPATAKEVIKKYVTKVKPFYEKLSSRHKKSIYEQKPHQKKTFSFSIGRGRLRSLSSSSSSWSPTPAVPLPAAAPKEQNIRHSHSFSGNLRYPRRKKQSTAMAAAVSCPSSMRSSPTHSGVLTPPLVRARARARARAAEVPTLKTASHQRHHSMEELHSAIQGAIAHCKSSMAKTTN